MMASLPRGVRKEEMIFKIKKTIIKKLFNRNLMYKYKDGTFTCCQFRNDNGKVGECDLYSRNEYSFWFIIEY